MTAVESDVRAAVIRQRPEQRARRHERKEGLVRRTVLVSSYALLIGNFESWASGAS